MEFDLLLGTASREISDWSSHRQTPSCRRVLEWGIGGSRTKKEDRGMPVLFLSSWFRWELGDVNRHARVGGGLGAARVHDRERAVRGAAAPGRTWSEAEGPAVVPPAGEGGVVGRSDEDAVLVALHPDEGCE